MYKSIFIRYCIYIIFYIHKGSTFPYTYVSSYKPQDFTITMWTEVSVHSSFHIQISGYISLNSDGYKL
jgi:hypothetical protein